MTGQLTFGRCCGYDLPIPSPDGRRLLLQACAGGMAYLLVARADGTRSRRVAKSTRGLLLLLSGDGMVARLAAIRVHSIDGDLYVASADGSAARPIATTGDVAQDLAWSRDGRSLAFRTSAGAELGMLFVLHNGAVRWIADASEFAWSPTGDWIAYDSPVSRFGPVRLHLIRPNGSAQRVLTPPYYGFRLGWSPDGRYLVSGGRGGDGVIRLGRSGVRYIGSDEGGPLGSRLRAGTRCWQVEHKRDLARRSGRRHEPRADRRSPVWGCGVVARRRALAYIVLGGVLPFYRGDLRLARLDGTVRTLVRAAGDYGGYMSGLAWTRPAAACATERP